MQRTIKDRRALTIYFHALTLDPVRENKKVNAFSVCVSWRHLRQPADMHETNLELGMYQFFSPNYFAIFCQSLFESVLSYESTRSEDAGHGASLSLVQGQG